MKFRQSALLGLWWILQTTTGGAADYLTYEQTAPSSVEDVPTSIEGLAEPDPIDAPTPLVSETDFLSPFWRDTSLDLKLRSYYLERNRDQEPDSLAWALGGWLSYRSGLWRDRLGLGASLYTSQGLYAPNQKPGSGLLKPEQEGFTVLGEAFVDLRVTGQMRAHLFRHTFDVPYVNKRDIRMVPNTFEAYLLFDEKDSRFNYVLGHVRKIKTFASDRFLYMSEAAGADGSNDGLTMAGALYRFSPTASIGAINHYGHNTFNTFYAEASGPWDLTDRFGLRLSGQYTHQNSVGDELAGELSTSHAGIKSDLSYGGAVLTLAYTRTGDSNGIRNPWGGSPSYASLILKDFDRAGEKAWRLGLSYDFAGIGLKGMSGFINYARGDTDDRGENASPDQEELDFTIDLRPPEGMLRGLWLRARAAFVDEKGPDAQDLTDYRIILNYELPLL